MAEAGNVFVVRELVQAGDLSAESADGERFEWSAARSPPNVSLGGARAIPHQAWELPGMQKTARTDYPGARRPSEQVLGPRHEPFTLNGRWDDRYNFPGYAVAEKRRFEDMCRRGNPVRIEFEDEVYEGLITNWVFTRRRRWDIGYQFTFSNHGRPDQAPASSATAGADAGQTFDEIIISAQSLLAEHELMPRTLMVGDTKDDVDDALGDLAQDLSRLSDSLDTRTGSRALRPLTTFKGLAVRMRAIKGDCSRVLDSLVAVRADVDMAARTAMGVLDFESWRRSLAWQTRLLLGRSDRGARDMDARAEPEPLRAYRPHKGESLYAISRRFYGTPYAWRIIADRNGLKTLELEGTELLMIPVRGEG